MLKIYNSIAREKQDFVPITPGKVKLYVCGMTVYDYCHLGHARVLVVFDTVVRWFEANDFAVNWLQILTAKLVEIGSRNENCKRPKLVRLCECKNYIR